MAEMKKKGRCWKGYKPKPGAKPYSKGSCIPEEKKMRKVNPWAVCTASTGREDKAKYERCVKAVKKESYNPVEDAEAADFGGKPLVSNPIRPKGDNLVRMKKKGKIKEGAKEDYKKADSDKRAQATFNRVMPHETGSELDKAINKHSFAKGYAMSARETAKKKKVNEGPDPRSKLGKIQHDDATAWIRRKNAEDAEKVGGYTKLRKIRNDQQKAKANNTQGQNKVEEATDEDRMRAAMEDDARVRKLKGKKPTPKALRRIPGTDKYVKEGAKEDYKKSDSDERAHDTFDRAEPFERRPYTHNSANTADKHDFARDRGESSRQPKKIRGRKETEREQNARRKYLKSTIKIRRRDR